MNPELIAQYDAAEQALDGLAAAGAEDAPALQAWLAREVAEAERSGSREWFARWVLAPLRALRLFEALQRGMVADLAEARQELARLDQELTRRQGVRGDAERERLERRRSELMVHEAALDARLDGAGGRRADAARERTARRLELALRFNADETAGLARDVLRETAATLKRLLGRIDGYDRLAREARSLAGGMELPGFLLEDVARLRAAASLDALRLQLGPRELQLWPGPSDDAAPVVLAVSQTRAIRTG
jgi:hypothetical protein